MHLLLEPANTARKGHSTREANNVKHLRIVSRAKVLEARVHQGVFLTVLEFLLLRLTDYLADKKSDKQGDVG